VRQVQSAFVSMSAAAAVIIGSLALGPIATAASDPPPALPVLPSTPLPATAISAASVAGSVPAATAPAAADVQAAAPADDDMSPSPAQPDFTLASLSTTLRLPLHKMAFRVTHRFTRPLGQGSFGQSLGDLFGLDSGAQIGLELRFAPLRGAQIGFYRTSDKTIDFFGSYNVLQSLRGLPVAVSAIAAFEGTNNFKDSYSPSIGAVISATAGDRAAFYLEPTWVNNTNPLPKDLVNNNNTAYVGIGARIRMTKTSYFVAEVSPRLAGYKGGDPTLLGTSKYQEGNTLASFGFEKQVGGHVFQLNVSNAFATTPANIARGAASGKTNWYLGFNISRKFY
jgi:hypothetical protein